MKITIHTLATDDDNGTSGGAFATEDQMWDSLIESTGKWSSHTREDADEWLKEQGDPDLTYHDWWEEHRGDMDSYTCDEVELNVDLCAQPLPKTGHAQVQEAIECLRRARDLLKIAGNQRTLLRVRAALSSAKGAARIQWGREMRAARQLVEDHREKFPDLTAAWSDEEKADMKHNAQMLDGCETEDELNAELRAQTQGN